MIRDTNIDKTKAISILLMIAGHCDSIWNTKFFYMIFSFHMPLFFIFSGYFYRPKTNKELIKHEINKLIKPYIITAIIAIIFLLLNDFQKATNYAIGALIGCMGSWNPLIKTNELQAGPIWFLLALFWCKIYYNIIQKRYPKHTFLICIILTLIFWKIDEKIMNLPLCIGCGFTGLFFYGSGIILRKRNINNFKYRWIAYAIWIFAFNYSYLNMAQYIYTWFPLSMLGAICGTITFYDLSKFIKDKAATILLYIGNHTLDILCCHTIAWVSRIYILHSLHIEQTIINQDLSYIVLTIIYSITLLSLKSITIKN